MSYARQKYMGRGKRVGRNPSEALEEAKEMVEKFHGRKPRNVLDLVEQEYYTKDLAVLGQLIELNILMEDGERIVPISFIKGGNVDPNKLDDYIQVCSDPKGKNIYFKGGNQELDVDKLIESGIYAQVENGKSKDLCVVGPVYSIVYWTDKHHLEGPKYQAKGTAYEHEFGEEADKGEEGEMPTLIYDTRNKKMMLSGGSYEVREEGIWN